MNSVNVPRKSRMSLGHVEGDLEVGRDAVIMPDQGDTITVNGRVEAEGNVTFGGNLVADEVRSEDGDFDVRGDLTVSRNVRVDDGILGISGSLSAQAVEVDKDLEVARDATVEELDVGGRAEIHGTLSARSVDVGGSLQVSGAAEVDEIEAGGSIHIAGKVNGKSIDVGGFAKIGGGKVTDQIDVGGTFESTGPLEFNEIDVGGVVKLSGDCSGRKLDVGGMAKVEGNLRFEEIDVGGVIEVEGNADGADLDIGGILRVGGDLNLTGRFEVGGRCKVGGTLNAHEIETGGRLEAAEVKVHEIEVGGAISTDKGVKADSITIGDHGRVRGPLIGGKIRIGQRADVEALYGKSITLEERSKAASIHGVDIRIGSHCSILGEVLYSGSLETDEQVSLAVQPKKVESLPEAPT